MTVFAITVIVVIAIIVIVVLGLVGMYNSFVKLKNNVEEAFATMDVYLKKRFDLIPNLVQTVKGYATHESETLDKVLRARSMIQNSSSQEERLDNENLLSGTLRSLFAVSEAYPDLKANENFLDLSDQIKRVEEDIANSRKYYNAVVKMYNTKREVFPNNIIAGMFHFDKKPLYEVVSQEERENVKVEF